MRSQYLVEKKIWLIKLLLLIYFYLFINLPFKRCRLFSASCILFDLFIWYFWKVLLLFLRTFKAICCCFFLLLLDFCLKSFFDLNSSSSLSLSTSSILFNSSKYGLFKTYEMLLFLISLSLFELYCSDSSKSLLIRLD